MTASALSSPPSVRLNATDELASSPFSISIYGDPKAEISDLLASVRVHGILVPIVVCPASGGERTRWEVLSGHRRLACARALGILEVPCEVREVRSKAARRLAVLEYNRQRSKTFSQLMREADALEVLYSNDASKRRRANLRQFQEEADGRAERRDSDDRAGRTDVRIAAALNLGGKDLYRQARAIWKAARDGDVRASSSLSRLDGGTKSVHAAYKDLRRRDRFSAGFRPTPYDVWSFKHDRAFGIPHPGSIPPAVVAHTLHYYTAPGALVIDPMAGGGTTLDVCESMGRRCLAYDLHPVRPEIRPHDVNEGLPLESHGCDLIFCDPPYHTMLARRYGTDGVANVPLSSWIAFLERLAAHCEPRRSASLAAMSGTRISRSIVNGFVRSSASETLNERSSAAGSLE